MGQVTIYLDQETESKLKRAAKASHLSVSKWVASIIKDKIKTEWPQDIVALVGSWKDDCPSLEEIRSGSKDDVKREELSAIMTEEYLERRAKRANSNKFKAVLDKVPNRPPIAGDEL